MTAKSAAWWVLPGLFLRNVFKMIEKNQFGENFTKHLVTLRPNSYQKQVLDKFIVLGYFKEKN